MLRSDVLSILKLVGLYEEATTIAGSLSYGIQRRLELAITLALKPTVLLLDEPTGGVAPKEANELMELVTGLVREQGLTAVFIEHDMNVVFNFSEKVRVMHLGKIIVEGTPMEVRNNREVQNIYLGEVGS
jgi:branched-chain amino acid transport system ATP-binding protein